MTRWTKPEHYTAKALAWQSMKERLRGYPITGMWENEAHLIPPSFSLGVAPMDIDPGSFHPLRIRAEWGGRRNGKTERLRNWAINMASSPDKSVRAKWINGRLWILEDGYDG